MDYLWRRARGKFIAWLEGDDFWTHPQKLQKQVEVFRKYAKAAICFHACDVWDEDLGTSLGQFPGENLRTTRIQDLIFGNFIMTPTVMYRRGNVAGVPDWIWSLPLGDWPLHLMFAAKGDIIYIHERMATYRMHSLGAWSRRPLVDRITETIQVLNESSKHLPKKYRLICKVASLRFHDWQQSEQERAGLPLSELPSWTARKAKFSFVKLSSFRWRRNILRSQSLCKYL